ncbi:Endothelial zinc finger protein induced by tumor necrosis factor alpha [Beauveria bassiana]|uniref:Endothelial zinc finger protein induced by tumor necrosis factor alpha n=1 Tax=Beauveria bassiana TaxID=176275 RepID=A0A2N6NIF2_BEABA|nr:Endothelial zinc finger protein induced by tumor necrosis factor alpha [Beauveria bassiana]
MDLTNVLNNRGGTIVQHPHHFANDFMNQHHLAFGKPEPDMDRSNSPHMSDHSTYSAHSMPRSYHSSAVMHAPMQIPSSMPATMHVQGFPDMHHMATVPNMAMTHMQPPNPVDDGKKQKTHQCSTCDSAFARRSDLSRHERIHSGNRPHSCDVCGKQFIQRSALTVHKRVHTGEKPHQCETCGKKFGDSSSLARHRRTHSGQRPYVCPFADCQKTFTRKTTLTRHKSNHIGTVEQSAVARAAALASANPKNLVQPRSDGDHLSSHGSPLTTPSPGQRAMSMSPGMDLGAGLNRHHAEFQYLQQGGPLPAHLRVGSPASTASGYSNPGGMRPTSHPTNYVPPPTLEPSVEHHQQGSNGSTGGSPHMSSMGWQSPSQHLQSPSQHLQSPSHHHLQSPSHHLQSTAQNAAAGYAYPDPDNYPPSAAAMNQMYYNPPPQMRRPQSTEPGLVHMA